MGTPGSGRKRTPVKDRFSAEDEALSNIAREVCTEEHDAAPRCWGRQAFVCQIAVGWLLGTRHYGWPLTY